MPIHRHQMFIKIINDADPSASNVYNIITMMYMKSKLIILLTVLLFTLNTTAQNNIPKKAEKLFKTAETEYLNQNLPTAIELLKKATDMHPEYMQAWKLKAQIYTENNNYKEAKSSLEKLQELAPELSPKINYQLGLFEMDKKEYTKAIAYFEKAKETPTKSLQKKIKNKLNACQLRMEMMENKILFTSIALSDSVNSINDEYLPVFTADGSKMFFTRKIGNGRLANEDFYWSEKNTQNDWATAKDMGAPINTELGQQGALSISPDGKRMFFAQKDKKNNFDLYYSYQVNGEWILPINVGLPVSTQHWESQPCISSDGTELYFASKRPGGKGGIDIWKSKLENNRWQDPINLSEINTEKDEQCPFLHPDGESLFFSSEGHPGMGEADLFKSIRQADGTWSVPENLGYPINTEADENSLIVDREGKTAYYARLVEGKGFDLFSFDLPKELQPNYVSYVKGIVTDAKSSEPLSAKVEIINLEDGTVINTINSAKEDGSFLLTLPIGKDYAFNCTKEGYLVYSDHFSLKEAKHKEPYDLKIGLNPEKTGASFVLKNIFFETGSYKLLSQSFIELDKLLALLQENPNTKLEIIGHTDNVGDDQNNLNLSTNRAKSVYEYIVDKGIVPNRLKYAGKGETEPLTTNDTEEGRAQNRRTEFKIIN